MKHPLFYVLPLLLSATTAIPFLGHAKGFDVKTLTTLESIHSGAVSPNGEFLVYGLTKFKNDIKISNLYIQTLNDSSNAIGQLTNHSTKEHDVVWSNDSKSIYFLSQRNGSSQVWRLPLQGGEALQITDLPIDVNGFKLSSDNKNIVLTLDVFNDCDSLSCNSKKLEDRAKSPNAGREYNQLMVRHWDTWNDGSYKHLFVGQLKDDTVSNLIDVTKGLATDIPAKPFSGMEEVNFSPDNKTIVYSAKAPSKNQANSTNFDIWQVNIDGTKNHNLTEKNKAWDAQPTFSDDGRYMAYAAMSKVGAESDRRAIMLKDLITGVVKEVAPLWDRSVRQMQFSKDSRNLIVNAQDIGQVSVFLINIQFGDIKQLTLDGSSSLIGVSDQYIITHKKSLDNPGQLYKINIDGSNETLITNINESNLKHVEFGQYSQFSFKGWNDEQVHGYWVKPANFNPKKKYPIAFLIHGGPQGSFSNSFSTRWNAQLWAGAGYGVVMIDFHGSTGYGQEFTQSINQDWGGKPLEDLQKGLAAAVSQQPWLDGDNACALGGSYGGYMVNWIAGNWPDKFKCLVNHAGLFDMRMFYNVTEELWFPNYDFGGSYQQVSDSYEKFNPVNYTKHWKTPMLVIHGEKDFRVPYGQGLAAFTVLQKNNIDSKLLIFPSENHWILNSDNKIQWYNNVLNWMTRHTKELK